MNRKIVALLLTTIVSVSLFCGCGKDGDDGSTRPRKENNRSASAAPTEEPLATVDPTDDPNLSKNEYTLEYYFSMPEYKSVLEQQIESAKQSYTGVYDDFSIDVYDNTMVYSYYFCEGAIKNSPDAIESQLKNVISSQIQSFKNDLNITAEVTLEYVYYDSDGSVYADVIVTE